MDAKPVLPEGPRDAKASRGSEDKTHYIGPSLANRGVISLHGQALSSVPSTKGYQDTHTDHSHLLTS